MLSGAVCLGCYVAAGGFQLAVLLAAGRRGLAVDLVVIPAATLPAPAPVCPCALACAGDTVASCVPVLNSGPPQFDAERACSVPYLLRPPAKLMGC